MNDREWNDLEVAPKSVVIQAAQQFASTVSALPQFQEYEQAYIAFRQDQDTQRAIQQFQEKQASLRALLLLNAISDEDRKELERLRDVFYRQPSVLRYNQAQEALIGICQEIGDLLTDAIGLDFGNSCKTGGCCG